jgi:hypothetical protein
MFVIAFVAIKNFNPCKKKIILKMNNKPRTVSNLSELTANKSDSKLNSQSINNFLLKEIVNPKATLLDEDKVSSLSSDDSSDDTNNARQVPPSILAATLIVYIVLGALIFQYYEKWSLMESIYYVVTSLLSIGFGDYVPGQQHDDPNVVFKFLIMITYFLFGLAMIGMVVRLAQDTATKSVEKLTAKLKNIFYTRKDTLEKSELNDEREKQEIIARIRMLMNYENILDVRKRHV